MILLTCEAKFPMGKKINRKSLLFKLKIDLLKVFGIFTDTNKKWHWSHCSPCCFERV